MGSEGVTLNDEARPMDQNLVDYLAKVEGIVREVKARLGGYKYPDDPRTVVLVGTITQTIEHHEAILLLIRNDKIGSAFALARSVFEAVYRGLWLNFSATEQQVNEFVEKDKLPLNLTEMAAAIDATYHAEGFFEEFRRKTWSALCSYAHTGMLQLGRRFTGAVAKPDYHDHEIAGVAEGITTCVILLAGRFLAAQSHVEDGKKLDALIGTYKAQADARTKS